jgi:hypothetical protein
VDVSTDSYWSSDWLDIALVDKDFLCLLTKSLDAVLWQWLALKECIDLAIKIRDVAEVNFGHFCLF